MKCSVYASSLGYDTDTIGCMACALAGALMGSEKIDETSSSTSKHSQIPALIFKHVESLAVINDYSDWLIERLKE